MKTRSSLLFLFIIASSLASAQCPTISAPATASYVCSTPVQVTATANYAANVVSRWIGPGNIPLFSTGTATSVISLNHIGTYTVEFTDTLSTCATSQTILVSANSNSDHATFQLVANSFTQACTNSATTLNIVNGNTWPTQGGALTYTITSPNVTLPTGILSPQSVYQMSFCGVYVAYARNSNSGCTSSFTIPITCATNTAPLLYASPFPGTVCAGNSLTLTVTGAQTYTWSTGATGSMIVVSPTVFTVYTMTGTASNGCTNWGNTPVTSHTGCTMVWPGDANYDGMVDNSDLLEVGLFYGTGGPPRPNASTTYTQQAMFRWLGTTGTNSQDRCHIDCNGDSFINGNDSVAIFLNYNQPHTFKPAPGGSNNISISSSGNNVTTGTWNKVDIVLGTSTTPVTQLYGIAFDVDYDQTRMEMDSVYLIYPNSFLDPSNQNLFLRKRDFNKGKVYAANVRTGGGNVTGNGVIAELHFKLAYGNTAPLTIGVSKAKMIDQQGVATTIASANTQLNTIDPVGIVGQTKGQAFGYYPNPVSEILTLVSGSSVLTSYVITDLSGGLLKQGTFSEKTQIDVSRFGTGMYLLTLTGDGYSVTKKLTVQ